MLDENSTLVHSMLPPLSPFTRTFIKRCIQFLHRAAAQQPQRPRKTLIARSTPDLILVVVSAGDVLDQICGLNLDQGDLNAEFSERRKR